MESTNRGRDDVDDAGQEETPRRRLLKNGGVIWGQTLKILGSTAFVTERHDSRVEVRTREKSSAVLGLKA